MNIGLERLKSRNELLIRDDKVRSVTSGDPECEVVAKAADIVVAAFGEFFDCVNAGVAAFRVGNKVAGGGVVSGADNRLGRIA